MFYLCFNFQLVFDPTVLKTAKQIIYEESGEDGFVCFLNEPSARWNRYFSSKKKHFILILSGAVVTNTWNTSCQPFSRLFMVGWRRSTGVSFTSCQLLFYRSHFSWPRLKPGYCWVVSPIKSSSSSSTYSLKAKEEPLMEITGVILSFCSTSAALAIHPNAHALSVWFCIYPTEGRLSTFLATWPWLDLMIVRKGGTTFAS